MASLHDAITAHATDSPDATVDEYCAWLIAKHGVYARAGLMWNTLRRLGLTLKTVRLNKITPTLPRPAASGGSCDRS